jgi:hypothetical protein
VIYIKSTVAGLFAVLAAYLSVVAIGISVLVIASVMSKEWDSGIGFDIVAFGQSVLGVAISVFAFMAGFFWEYLSVSTV